MPFLLRTRLAVFWTVNNISSESFDEIVDMFSSIISKLRFAKVNNINGKET